MTPTFAASEIAAGVPPVHPGARSARRTAPWTASALAALPLAIGALLPPARPLPFDLCLWHRLTGLDCLGCGLTRSVCHLMHGDLAGSLALHPCGVVVVAALATLSLVRGAEAVLGRPLRRRG